MVWHYALTAPNGHAARFVDPRPMKKKALTTHLNTTLLDATEPTAAERTAMKAVFNAVTDQAMLALAAQVIAAQQSAVTAPPSPTGSNADDDDVKGQGGEGGAPPLSTVTTPPSAPGTASLAPVAPGLPVSTTTSATTSTRSTKRRREEDASTVILVTCPSRCGKKVNSEDESLITFCPGCGKPWKELPPTTSASSSASTGPAPPRVWGGAATWNPPSMAQAIPDTPLRTLALAPWSEALTKRAREGQCFMSLHDCMQSHAVHGASTASFDLDRTFVMQIHDGGTVTRASDAATRAAQTAVERKRTISSFADIMEVFIHTLIGIIYIDRPDICVQLFALLIQAADVARSYDNWRLAFHYIEYQRLQHYKKAGPPPIHILAIATPFDMGRFSQEALDAAKNQLSTNPASSISGRKPPTANTCHDWNYRGSCMRNPCRFAHVCSTCASSSHTAGECMQPAPPGANFSLPARPNPGRGGRGGRGRGGRQPAGAASSSSLNPVASAS
jgi:hypothetical protein